MTLVESLLLIIVVILLFGSTGGIIIIVILGLKWVYDEFIYAHPFNQQLYKTPEEQEKAMDEQLKKDSPYLYKMKQEEKNIEVGSKSKKNK